MDEAILDGKDDSHVDLAFRSDDGHVLLIQSKYRKEDKSEEPEALDAFCDVLPRLHPKLGARVPKHLKLRDFASDIDWDSDSFELLFITLGKVNISMRERADRGASPIPSLPGIEDRVEIRLIDELGLNEQLREALNAIESIDEPVLIPLRRTGDEPAWLTVDSDNHRSFVGRIAASQLRELYKRYYTRLFSLNIRNYVGDTSTNKGIIETARQWPTDFFFYNNGIAAVATSIEPDSGGKFLKCERFSIINGAQTVRSLWKAHTKDPGAVAKAEVLIRVTEISLKDDLFLTNVTKFNNTQNAVKVSDFRSNDPVQRQLGRKFAELGRGGRKFLYRNKRGERPDATKIPIGMEEFAKTIYSFRFGPADNRGGTVYLFDTAKDAGYARVFGDGSEPWDSLPEEEFRLLAGTWFWCEQVRATLDEEKIRLEEREREILSADPETLRHPVVRQALERRWMVFFVVGELLRVRHAGLDLSACLRRLSRPRWTETEGSERQAVKSYVKAGCEILIKVYRNASRRPDFIHRNWFREERTLQEIGEEIRDSETLISLLARLTPES